MQEVDALDDRSILVIGKLYQFFVRLINTLGRKLVIRTHAVAVLDIQGMSLSYFGEVQFSLYRED